MNQTTSAIKITELSKFFRSGLAGSHGVQALAGVSMEVNKGEVFGLLGPNGAGKTTLVKILLGSLRATSGTARLNNIEISNPAARNSVGYLPENHRFPSYMTGRQLLKAFGGMAGMSGEHIKSHTDRLLETVRMTEWDNTKIKKYSKGMMQRVGLAQALLNDPDIIFLDEPTDGVDPIGRREIRDVLLELKKEGKTVFLNSHLLSEVESVCDRVAILDRGKLLKIGPAKGLIETIPTFRFNTHALSPEVAAKLGEAFAHIKIDGNSITASFEDARQVNYLIDFLRQNQVEIMGIIPEKISLEDSFMQLIRENIADA